MFPQLSHYCDFVSDVVGIWCWREGEENLKKMNCNEVGRNAFIKENLSNEKLLQRYKLSREKNVVKTPT